MTQNHYQEQEHDRYIIQKRNCSWFIYGTRPTTLHTVEKVPRKIATSS